MSDQSFPCPCCGCLTRTESEYGTFEICPVCYWEDDAVQAANPEMGGGANTMSLDEARESYRELGAASKDYLSSVREPLPDELPVSG